ncbi:aminotransferase class IV [Novacetimonas hansenii]|uniref:aminotransferase class IV n=1 Tax=Novacetimonas hansenii TaxID=436 RepID=UPI00177CB565|nr:aminotransferase class IV [Novacetimonas hansenii]QOF94901.1 aminotransferase class IV [Novacetimonas hansenii]
MGSLIYLNGEIQPAESARISPFDRAFLFGEGIYEVCIIINGQFVDMDSHLARLDRSLGACGMTPPPERAQLPQIMHDLAHANGITNGFAYLQVTPGATPRSFTAVPQGRPTVMILAQAQDFLSAPSLSRGITVQLQPDIRWLHRDIKTTMLLPQVMAKRSALANGVDDTLFFDELGITEGSSSNVFIVEASGTLITRPLSHHLLAGCTRARIITLAQDAGMKVEERIITRDELLRAPEVFVTSATYMIIPVTSIDGHAVGDGQTGEVTKRLQDAYLDFMRSLSAPATR